MATTIKLKNSVTTTNAPSSLAQGEVAINVTDKKVWVGNAATTPVQLLGSGADGNLSTLTVGAGTVSSPSITTTGDTNTGIFFPAADTIAFTEGGTEAMRIDSSGNVGIGTSSPQAPLNVSYSNDARADTLRLTNRNTGGYGSWLNFYGDYSGGYSFAKIRTENESTGATLRFHTADTSKVSQERMRITSSGVLELSQGQIQFPSTQVPSANANTLDDYEEGTWTPTQGAGLTVVGTFSSNGSYTKIGNLVTLRGELLGSTSIACAAGSALVDGGLPFTVSNVGGGTAANGGLNGGSVLYVLTSPIYTITAIGITGSIQFFVSYFV